MLTLLDGWQSPALTAVMSALTWLGSVLILLPLAVFLGMRHAGNFNPYGWRIWGFIPAAVTGATVLAHTLKVVTDRARPDLFPALVPMPVDASFPSAHSMQASAFVLAWLWQANMLQRPVPVLAGFSLIVMVALSRLYLQVHFPSDVIAGIVFGALWVMTLRALPLWQDKVRA